MKQKKSDKEVARLLKRWAMDVANRLRWREAFSASEAVRQAYLVQNCLEALGAGKVKLTYMKKDGEIREAVGTLCKGISAAYDNSIDDQLPRLLYRTIDGELFKRYTEEIPNWAQTII